MKQYNIGRNFSLVILLLATFKVPAQTGKSSMTVDNSTVTIAAGAVESRFSEGTYFGPDANWVIDGLLEIWSKNIWISPGATFSGTGKIIVYNPGDNPFYTDMIAGATAIDGNNSNFINLIIEHRNPENILLEDIDDPGFKTSNPAGSLSATLNVGGTLDLAVNNADIILNGKNLVFNTSGKIDNYDASRMVVTGNSITGHMVKDFGGNSAFVFPIGIAERDYTPVSLSPSLAGKLYVSVQDYPGAGTTGIKPMLGMDRSWHIYSSVPLLSMITLQHNQSTNGALFKDAKASITQFQGGLSWDMTTSSNPSLGVHTRSNVAIVTEMAANGAWFTKHSVSGSNVFIPNLFSPNGDGTNDVFEIRGLNLFAENNLVIINRWGNEVFHGSNYQNTWTGAGLNEGTYYYLLKVKDNAGAEWQVFKGYITLMREFKK